MFLASCLASSFERGTYYTMEGVRREGGEGEDLGRRREEGEVKRRHGSGGEGGGGGGGGGGHAMEKRSGGIWEEVIVLDSSQVANEGGQMEEDGWQVQKKKKKKKKKDKERYVEADDPDSKTKKKRKKEKEEQVQHVEGDIDRKEKEDPEKEVPDVDAENPYGQVKKREKKDQEEEEKGKKKTTKNTNSGDNSSSSSSNGFSRIKSKFRPKKKDDKMFNLAVVEEENAQLEEQAMSSMPEDSTLTAESASESANERTLRGYDESTARETAERSGINVDKIKETEDRETVREPKEYTSGGQWLVQVNEITQTCDVMRMDNDDYADAIEIVSANAKMNRNVTSVQPLPAGVEAARTCSNSTCNCSNTAQSTCLRDATRNTEMIMASNSTLMAITLFTTDAGEGVRRRRLSAREQDEFIQFDTQFASTETWTQGGDITAHTHRGRASLRAISCAHTFTLVKRNQAHESTSQLSIPSP
ncbi:myb-like protein X [Penaeus japonicus]|uniref:myb-like protein X n=1 Tax=Penaeus japonicus TaxID=27405 RepID=UPI001C7108AD|nr:myb-like protein X [Penaeus japonicus]